MKNTKYKEREREREFADFALLGRKRTRNVRSMGIRARINVYRWAMRLYIATSLQSLSRGRIRNKTNDERERERTRTNPRHMFKSATRDYSQNREERQIMASSRLAKSDTLLLLTTLRACLVYLGGRWMRPLMNWAKSTLCWLTRTDFREEKRQWGSDILDIFLPGKMPLVRELLRDKAVMSADARVSRKTNRLAPFAIHKWRSSRKTTRPYDGDVSNAPDVREFTREFS